MRRDPPLRSYVRPSRPRASYTAVRRDAPTRFARPTLGRPSAYTMGAARAALEGASGGLFGSIGRAASSAWGTAKSAGSVAWGGLKSAGAWAWRNRAELALTALMFVPGGQVIRGAAWATGGLAALRGTRAAGALARGARALGAGRLASRGKAAGSRFIGGARASGRRILREEAGAVRLPGWRGPRPTRPKDLRPRGTGLRKGIGRHPGPTQLGRHLATRERVPGPVRKWVRRATLGGLVGYAAYQTCKPRIGRSVKNLCRRR